MFCLCGTFNCILVFWFVARPLSIAFVRVNRVYIFTAFAIYSLQNVTSDRFER